MKHTMKEAFEAPELEIVAFGAADIITMSGLYPDDEEYDPNEAPLVPPTNSQ